MLLISESKAKLELDKFDKKSKQSNVSPLGVLAKKLSKVGASHITLWLKYIKVMWVCSHANIIIIHSQCTLSLTSLSLAFFIIMPTSLPHPAFSPYCTSLPSVSTSHFCCQHSPHLCYYTPTYQQQHCLVLLLDLLEISLPCIIMPGQWLLHLSLAWHCWACLLETTQHQTHITIVTLCFVNNDSAPPPSQRLHLPYTHPLYQSNVLKEPR